MVPAFPVVLMVILHLQESLAMKWDPMRPIVTAYADRHGHNYLFVYDYQASVKKEELTGVGVRVGLNEITFSQYPLSHYYGKKSCMSFLTLRGVENTCKQFFLVVDDWYKFERRTWDKGYGVQGCNALQFYNSVLVFIKYDVQKDTSPKFVGTYSTTRDRLYYFDHENRKIMITNFKQRISAGIMSATKFEVVCTNPRV